MKFFLSVFILIAWTISSVPAVEFTRAQSGKISQWVGQILEGSHYKHAPLDDTISEMFLKNYLDALDYNHLIFLQTDLDELNQRYGTTLDDLTRKADAKPAFEIFDLYLQRLDECRQLVQKLLQEEFDFTKDESFTPSRNKAPWPKDKREAEQLWRARIKYELLLDRLAKNKTAKTSKESTEKTTEAKPPAAVQPKPEDALKIISKRYDRLLKDMRKFAAEDILQIYLTSLAHAYDPHTDYMAPSAAENFSIESIKNSLEGIGAQLRSEDGYTKIVKLIPGGPAIQSKQLNVDDSIIAVAQADGEPVDTVEMKLNKVVEMIRGKRGTEVRLTVVPANSTDGTVKKVVTLIREKINLPDQLAKAKVVDHPDGASNTVRLGVITLPGFYENCTRDVEKLIERLKKENISGLVLDLRHNGGGILEEAVELTGLFIEKGPVVQVKDSRNRTQVKSDDDAKVVYDGPLIVLAGRLSASASEITAAALQDYGRALIVGDQSTHGKGTVQQLLSLKQILGPEFGVDPGQLKMTIAKFYRVAGGTTQKRGVTPEIVLPSRYDYLDLGEASLPNCLPDDTTTPLTFPQLNRVRPFVSELSQKSAERIRRDTDFGYLNEDIEVLKKQRADKSISLNEAKRLQESNDMKSREEARKKERAERKPTSEKVFDLNLAMVDQNKPISSRGVTKAKDDETLIASAKTAADDDAENENEPAIDVQLEETLNILNDYGSLLAKTGDKLITEKPVVNPQ